jgi:hypothetical protein
MRSTPDRYKVKANGEAVFVVGAAGAKGASITVRPADLTTTQAQVRVVHYEAAGLPGLGGPETNATFDGDAPPGADFKLVMQTAGGDADVDVEVVIGPRKHGWGPNS